MWKLELWLCLASNLYLTGNMTRSLSNRIPSTLRMSPSEAAIYNTGKDDVKSSSVLPAIAKLQAVLDFTFYRAILSE